MKMKGEKIRLLLLFFVLLALFYSLFFSGDLFAYRLTGETAKEYFPVETLQSIIDSFRVLSMLLVFLLLISLSLNLFLLLALKKAQNQLQSIVDFVKQIDIMKEAVAKIATQVKKSQFKDDSDIDEIDIIKRGF